MFVATNMHSSMDIVTDGCAPEEVVFLKFFMIIWLSQEENKKNASYLNAVDRQ